MDGRRKPHSEEWKKNLREQMLAKNNPFYGKKHTRDSIKKMIEKKTGKNNPNFGKPRSEDTKKKIGDAQRGKKNHMFGKHHSEDWKKNHSNRMSGKNNPMYGVSISGEQSHQWKGEFVSYEGLHIWARKNKPKPELCEMCNFFKPKHLSNISGEYRRDVNDFQWLCISCHNIYDRQTKDVIGTVSIERRRKYKE